MRKDIKSIIKREYKNLPIFLIFYIFPVISIAARLLGLGQINYDYFWIPAIGVSILMILGTSVKSRFKKIFALLGLLFTLKYLLPLLYVTKIQFQPWLMDIKWLFYLLFAIVWICKYGYPIPARIYQGGLFFSKLYIIYTFFVLARGNLSREGIIMESNYDGFMILMAFCWMDLQHWRKRDLTVFILATFLTFSRTGLMALSLLFLYKYSHRNILYLLPFIPIGLGILYFAYSIRGEDSAGNMDRFVYFYQAYTYLTHTSWGNILLGSTPGISLGMPIVEGFDWLVENFENRKELTGIYPFYFHSTYLRLFMTWGIFAAIAYMLYFLVKFWKSSYMPMKYFCLLTLCQSISLSTMTLQNVSVLFFLMLFTMLRNEKKQVYDTQKNSLLLVKYRFLSKKNRKLY